jgi:hypothetical protein
MADEKEQIEQLRHPQAMKLSNIFLLLRASDLGHVGDR